MRRFSLLLFASFILSACTPKEKYPEAYGLYYWNNNLWQTFPEGGPKIELNLASNVKFLIHEKSVDRYMASFEVAKKIYVRNIIESDPGQPPRKTTPYRKWDKQSEYQIVTGKFSPIKGESEMVTWSPNAPLDSGIYEPKVGGAEMAAFTVNRSQVLSSVEESSDCFDLIRTNFGGLPMGVPDTYKPCVGEPNEEILKFAAELHRGVPDASRLKRLLARGASLTTKFGDGTVLGAIVSSGRKDLLEFALNSGANVNLVDDPVRGVPLSFSANNPEILEILIAKGANVNAQSKDGSTMLHVFCTRPEMINVLFASKANPDIKNKFGQTPLSLAMDQLKIGQENRDNFDKSELLAAIIERTKIAIELIRKNSSRT